MSKPTLNTKTPSPVNPSSLPSRYSIRSLTPSHIPVAAAIIAHANVLCSPVWPVLYPSQKTARLHTCYAALDYLVSHQIDSGMSFGVFNDEYQYRRAESGTEGDDGAGKVYWDIAEKVLEDDDAEKKRLLDQIDSPLVSIALSYDAFLPLDMQQMSALTSTLPHYPLVFTALDQSDPRDPASWKATGPGQVLMRNATATRLDHEGQGIMSGLARWLMREAAGKGYRGVQIECLNDAVTHVWGRPERPFGGGVVCEFEMGRWRDGEGRVAFEPAEVRVTRCWVDMKMGV